MHYFIFLYCDIKNPIIWIQPCLTDKRQKPPGRINEFGGLEH